MKKILLTIGVLSIAVSAFSQDKYKVKEIRDVKMKAERIDGIKADDTQERIQKMKLAREVESFNDQFVSKILFNQIQEEQSNFIYSPLSLINALHLVSEGAKGNTALEIYKALWNKSAAYPEERRMLEGWMKPVSKEEKQSLWNANAIWINKDFQMNKEYEHLLKTTWHAEARTLDFGNPRTVDIINFWVKNKTNEKIEKLMDGVNKDDAIVITNAIYFKDDWQKQFKSHLSREAIFNGEKGSDMISYLYGEQNVHYIEREDHYEIGIPMKNNHVLYIILPKENSSVKDVLDNKINNKEVWGSTFTVNETFNIMMPKFKLEESYFLDEAVKSTGIKDIFNPSRANLTGISNHTNLYVSKIIQKTYLDISEEGIEGAAATGISVSTTSVKILDEIKINRPFIYLLKDINNKSTIFAGYINEPPVR